jgi:hypothetical protein
LFFAWDISVTAGTAEATPKTQVLKLTSGVLTGVDVKFPSGCHGLVKVRLKHWESPLVPLSRGEWITGDDESVKAPMYFELPKGPYELKFEGASPSASFDHTVTVRVSILPRAVASMVPLIEMLTRLFQRMGLFG